MPAMFDALFRARGSGHPAHVATWPPARRRRSEGGTGRLRGTRYEGRFNGCHSGDGIRLVESPARNVGALAWAVANELSRVKQQAVVLTPDATGEKVRQVLARVQSQPPFNRNRNAGTTFGPYPLTWERREEDESAALLAIVPDGDWLAVHEAIGAFSALAPPLAGTFATDWRGFAVSGASE